MAFSFEFMTLRKDKGHSNLKWNDGSKGKPEGPQLFVESVSYLGVTQN